MKEFPVSFFEFISSNKNKDINKLILGLNKKIFQFDIDFAFIQIDARKRHSSKLNSFFKHNKFLVPSLIAAEQATHELIARYHASFINASDRIIDMTAGLGIDSMTFSRVAEKVFSFDIDELKADCLEYNARLFNLKNLYVFNDDSVKFLKNSENKFDVAFIDPARRDEFNRKMVSFSDCQPNLIELIPLLKEKCNKALIKASPLLDIKYIAKTLPCVKAIRTIGIKNECKEILVELDFSEEKHEIFYESIDFTDFNSLPVVLSFKNSEIEEASINYSVYESLHSGGYLYEPNAETMKLSPWSVMAKRYSGIIKLDKSTHVFYHDDLIREFPGRKLKIISVLQKKDRLILKDKPVNIVSRNYPKTAELLRKELRVKEGKNQFLYAVRVDNKPVLILAELINLN